MDYFFTTLRTSLVAFLFLAFTTVATYVPAVPTSHVEPAEAAGSIVYDPTHHAETILNVIQNTVTAVNTSALWLKENVLDGLGWTIAKRIVSGIIRSLINWVNSGFQGSPSFVTDLQGFLLNIADEEIGNIISDIGDGSLAFICSPFRLDAQLAIATQYGNSRDQAGSTAPACTLTGIIDNIEGFIQGVDPGNGLADWLTITSQPQSYTPYGNVLEAQAVARARLINAQGEQVSLLGFADGFFSKEICESIDGPDGRTAEVNCQITLPGKIIADQVNNALDTGRQTLVEADEINELIAALLGQLANQALTGVAGLLGLSGGDGFGGYSSGPSYLDDLYEESGGLVEEGGAGDLLADALLGELAFRDEAVKLQTGFTTFIGNANASTSAQGVARAQAALLEIEAELITTDQNIAELQDLIDRYPAADDDERVDILLAYTNINLTGGATGATTLRRWQQTADELGILIPE